MTSLTTELPPPARALLCAIVIGVTEAMAEQVSALAVEPLTLERALDLAERNNPRLRVAAAQTEGARAGIITAKAYPNPYFDASSGRQFAFLDSTISGFFEHYGFTQPLETPGVRRTRLKVAELGRDSSDLALVETRLSLRAAVKQAFYNVLRRKNEIELARENLRLIEDLRRRIQVQVEVGEAARLELIRADSEVATARTFANSAQLRLVTGLAALGALLGVPQAGNLEVRGELNPPMQLPALESLQADVLTRHPAIAQAKSLVRRGEAVIESEKAQRVPQPSVGAEFERYPDNYLTKFGVVFPLPFWNRREGPIAQAVAGLREAQANVDLRSNELRASLENAYGQYQLASQQVLQFRDGVLREAEAAVQAAESAYRFGERGIVEVLDAQRVLRSVRSDFLAAQYDRQAAMIELERLQAVTLGGTNP